MEPLLGLLPRPLSRASGLEKLQSKGQGPGHGSAAAGLGPLVQHLPQTARDINQYGSERHAPSPISLLWFSDTEEGRSQSWGGGGGGEGEQVSLDKGVCVWESGTRASAKTQSLTFLGRTGFKILQGWRFLPLSYVCIWLLNRTLCVLFFTTY